MAEPLWIGIDPGVKGAIGVLNNVGLFYAVYDMPIETQGKKSQVSPIGLYHILNELMISHGIAQITIEQVHSMPKQGVASSFNFGMSYGIARGVACGVHAPTMLITPQKWKKLYTLIGKDKDQSRTVAQSKWPECQDLKRKKDSDRAESLLIAQAGMRLANECLGRYSGYARIGQKA